LQSPSRNNNACIEKQLCAEKRRAAVFFCSGVFRAEALRTADVSPGIFRHITVILRDFVLK
jgi:hypothetical protein